MTSSSTKSEVDNVYIATLPRGARHDHKNMRRLESAQGSIAQPAATRGEGAMGRQEGMGMLFCQHAQAVFESDSELRLVNWCLTSLFSTNMAI